MGTSFEKIETRAMMYIKNDITLDQDMTTRLPLCCLGCLETPSDRKHLGVQGLGQGRETPALTILPAPSFPNFAEPQMWQDQAPLLLSSETLTPGWGSSPCPAGWRLQSHLLNTVHVPRVFFGILPRLLTKSSTLHLWNLTLSQTPAV